MALESVKKGVSEDIETGNDLVGGLKAEPADISKEYRVLRIFPGTRHFVLMDYHLVGRLKKAFFCLTR